MNLHASADHPYFHAYAPVFAHMERKWIAAVWDVPDAIINSNLPVL